MMELQNTATIDNVKVSELLPFDGASSSTLSDEYSMVGISADNVDIITEDVKRYIIDPVETALDELNTTNLFDESLKGPEVESACMYIEAIKNLARSYVSRYKGLIDLVNKSYEAMVENDKINNALVEERNEELRAKVSQMIDFE